MAEQDCKIEYQYFYTTKEWTTPEGEHKTQKEPRVTVCYIRTTDCTAVGVAICGPHDNPCRKTGKKIARQRAQHALGLVTETEKPFLPIQSCQLKRREALDIYSASDIKIGRFWESKICGHSDLKYRLERLPA